MPVGTLDAWLGALAFGGQIFFDFAGYSTTAIGAALCLGFSIPENVRDSYAAVGFSDFWKRWHISLSSWLRDYLYIPLGGNRYGPARMYVALMLTMLLGGLWHGASWTFIVWGGLHGVFLWGERGVKRVLGDRPWTQTGFAKWAAGGLTFFLVILAWVFFRAQDFGTAQRLISSMFGMVEGGVAAVPTTDMVLVLGLVVV